MLRFHVRQLFSTLRKPAHTNRHRKQSLAFLQFEDRTNPSTFTVLNIDDDGGVNPAVVANLDGSDNGTGTLRQAIVNANANPGADSIVFDATAFGTAQVISLAAALPSLTGATTITGTQDGSAANLVTVSGGGAVSIFSTASAPAATLITFDKLIFSSGNAAAAAGGGALTVGDENVTISNSTLTANAALQGGAIRVTAAGTLTINSSTLTANTATFTDTTTVNTAVPPVVIGSAGGGGAIRVTTNTVLNINNSTLQNNTGNNDAGVIYGSGSIITIVGSQFTTNRALGSTTVSGGVNLGGGAIRGVGSSKISISQSTFTGNTSGVSGGAIQLSASSLTITDSLFTGNKATGTIGGFIGRGGAIFANGASQISLTNTRITGSSALVLGGAVYLGSSATATLSVNNCTLDANTAGNAGGAIDTFGPGSITVNNSTFSNNVTSNVGGAIAVNAAVTTILVQNSTFVSNTSATGAGALHFNAQTAATSLTVRNSTITKNVSNSTSSTLGATAGGIAVNSAATLNLTSSIVSGNTHSAGGGFSDVSINASGTLTANFSAIGSNAGHSPVLTISSTPTPGTNLDYGSSLALGVLADNGGALQGPTGNTITGKTIELLAGSAAINAGSNPGALTTDARGGTFAREIPTGSPDIGAFERVPGAPSAIGGPYINIDESNFGTQDPYVFTVKYAGDFNLDYSKLGSTDVRVKSTASGYDTLATFVSASPAVNSTAITATYKVSAPLGGWTPATNGLYTISVEPNEVFLAGSSLSVPATTLGGFFVTRDYIVTSPNDTGAGTLRQAILDSNAAEGANVIRFNSAFNTSNSILVDGQMTVSDSLTIVGPGADKLALDGNNFNRIFNITNTSSQLTVTLSGMKLFNASSSGSGGAIFFGDERLTLNDMFLAGSTASNGGAIGNSNTLADGPTLTINRSAITGNVSANRGGAIMFYSLSSSSLALRNSTVSGNSASGLGGAFYGFNWNSATHKLTVSNSTITNNTSITGGGGIRVSNTATPVITLQSSIVAGNSGPASSPDILNGTVNSSFSAIGNTTGYTVGTSTSDILPGTDLQLQPLDMNGGPTPTHAFLATSPLKNAGSNPNSETVDQRGSNRVVDGAPDIGALESSSGAPVVTGIVVNGNPSAATQRSRLTTIQVNFAAPVDAAQFQAAGAVFLTRVGIPTNGLGTVGTIVNTTNGLVISPSTGTVSSITLTFDNITNAGVNNTSLADGRWELSVVPAGYVANAANTGNQLRRLFGDIDNNGSVDAVDFSAFPPFGAQVGSQFDFDNNSDVDANDFAAFGGRNGYSLA